MKKLLLLLTLTSCAPRPATQLRAPALIERALSVASDLEATAVLVPAGGAALDAHALAADDDGVTFTGFIDAAPGQYTLEITFTGVPAGAERHFLGRLTSDTFTVVQGEATTPTFSKPVDVLGRDGDGGDDDGDKLGFLLELLLGTDPASSDSDSDSILDGEDCAPADNAVAIAIAEGGGIDDCDGDGHDSITPLLGDPGDDCDDTNDQVHPGVEDICTDDVDSDCNNQTCPIADFDGPQVTVLAPDEGATIGCHARLSVEAVDPSGVQGVLAQFPESPINGNITRTLLLVEGSDDVWTSGPIGSTGPGLSSGPELIVLRASDASGNTTEVQRNVALAIDFPTVNWDAPETLSDAPVAVTLTPAGAHPLVALEVHAAPLDENGILQLAGLVTLGAVDVAGGSITIDPADLPSANSAVFPFARDDVGNELVPFASSFPSQGSMFADFLCDGANHEMPVAVKRAGRGLVTLADLFDQAISIANGIDPNAELVSIFALGIDANGAVDLDDPGFTKRWQFTFKAPTQPRNGMGLLWAPAGFASDNPQILDVAVDPGDPVLVNIDGIRDSADFIPVYAARPLCDAPGFTGNENDQLVITNVDGVNRIILIPNNQQSLILDANTLGVIVDCS